MSLQEQVLTDLMERVKRLEKTEGNQEINDTLVGLDRMAAISSISINAIFNVLEKKKLITREEMESAVIEERKRVDDLMRKASEKEDSRGQDKANNEGTEKVNRETEETA